MESNDITVFVDESGTIAKGQVEKDDFFIVTLLLVRNEDIDHVKKVFKKERLKIVNRKEKLKKTFEKQ